MKVESIVECHLYLFILSKKATLKKTEICFQDQLSLNAGQKYCRMLQRDLH